MSKQRRNPQLPRRPTSKRKNPQKKWSIEDKAKKESGYKRKEIKFGTRIAWGENRRARGPIPGGGGCGIMGNMNCSKTVEETNSQKTISSGSPEQKKKKKNRSIEKNRSGGGGFFHEGGIEHPKRYFF